MAGHVTGGRFWSTSLLGQAQITARTSCTITIKIYARFGSVPLQILDGGLRSDCNYAFNPFNASCSKLLLFEGFTAPYWSNPPSLIFDIRALWRSVLSASAPECQKLKVVG